MPRARQTSETTAATPSTATLRTSARYSETRSTNRATTSRSLVERIRGTATSTGPSSAGTSASARPMRRRRWTVPCGHRRLSSPTKHGTSAVEVPGGRACASTLACPGQPRSTRPPGSRGAGGPRSRTRSPTRTSMAHETALPLVADCDPCLRALLLPARRHSFRWRLNSTSGCRSSTGANPVASPHRLHAGTAAIRPVREPMQPAGVRIASPIGPGTRPTRTRARPVA